jgi:hypothetical protein
MFYLEASDQGSISKALMRCMVLRGGCAANPKCVVHGVDGWIKGIGEMKCHIRPGTFRSRRVNKTQIPGCKSPRTAGSALEPISFERGGRWDVWGDVWG